MARQKGIITIEGTLGNITFFKSQDGYMAREKGGVSAEKIASDPAFERTRENNAEFGRAGKASKLLRTSVKSPSLVYLTMPAILTGTPEVSASLA